MGHERDHAVVVWSTARHQGQGQERAFECEQTRGDKHKQQICEQLMRHTVEWE
jgi:hypothetical protein